MTGERNGESAFGGGAFDGGPRKSDCALIFFAGLFLFLVGHGGREFIGFECRFALFAKEMMERGPSFFPTVYGEPYPDYPSFQTVLIWLASLPLGRVTAFTAVLPTAVFASITLVLTYRIGAARSRRLGFQAVLLELLTFGFTSSARSLSLDHLLSACTAFAFWAADPQADGKGKTGWWLLGLALAAGFSFRGPIGLVIPAAVVAARWLFGKDLRKLAATLLLAALLSIILLSALLLAARQEGGAEFAGDVLRMEAAGRVGGEGSKPIYYYWIAGLGAYAVSFPLGLAAMVVFRRRIFGRGDGGDPALFRSLAAWTLVILAGMSIPGAKKARYILPLAPATALLGAHLFETDPRRPGRAVRIGTDLITGIFAILPAIGLFASLAAPPLVRSRGLDVEFPVRWPLLAFACEGAVAVAIFFLVKGAASRRTPFTAVGALAFATIQIAIVEPIQIARERTRPFVEEVERLRGEGRKLVFYEIGPDAEDIKYVANMDAPVRPAFVRKPEEAMALGREACFVAEKKSEKGLEEMFGGGLRVVARGKIGHRECLAFFLEPDPGR